MVPPTGDRWTDGANPRRRLLSDASASAGTSNGQVLQAVCGPPKARIRSVSGRPAGVATEPSGVTLSEDWGGGGAAAPSLDTYAGHPTLNPGPDGVRAVPNDVFGSHVGPRTVDRRPAGTGGGVPAPKNPQAGVAGPAAPAAGAAAAPLKCPDFRRRRYSVQAQRPQTR